MAINEFINLIVYRGNDLSIELHFKDRRTQDPIDITGWIVSFTVKEKTYNPDIDAKIAIDITNHTDPINGKTIISIPNSDTEPLLGVYEYDIQFKTHVNLKKTFARGQIEILDNVTRR